MRIPEALGITFGIAFAANVVLIGFGSLQRGRFRRAFDRAVGFGLRCFVIYLCAALLFVTFQGLSPERSLRSTLANIFAVTLAVLAVAVFLVDFVSREDPRPAPTHLPTKSDDPTAPDP